MANTASAKGTPTPAKVKQLATEQAHLDRTALLGIFGAQNSLRALILTSSGKTKTVSLGDRINGSTIVAIAPDQVVLSRHNTQKIMHLPRS